MKSRYRKGWTSKLPLIDLHFLIEVWEEDIEDVPDEELEPNYKRAVKSVAPGQDFVPAMIRHAYLARKDEQNNEYIDAEIYLTKRDRGESNVL